MDLHGSKKPAVIDSGLPRPPVPPPPPPSPHPASSSVPVIGRNGTKPTVPALPRPPVPPPPPPASSSMPVIGRNVIGRNGTKPALPRPPVPPPPPPSPHPASSSMPVIGRNGTKPTALPRPPVPPPPPSPPDAKAEEEDDDASKKPTSTALTSVHGKRKLASGLGATATPVNGMQRFSSVSPRSSGFPRSPPDHGYPVFLGHGHGTIPFFHNVQIGTLTNNVTHTHIGEQNNHNAVSDEKLDTIVDAVQDVKTVVDGISDAVEEMPGNGPPTQLTCGKVVFHLTADKRTIKGDYGATFFVGDCYTFVNGTTAKLQETGLVKYTYANGGYSRLAYPVQPTKHNKRFWCMNCGGKKNSPCKNHAIPNVE